MPWQMYGSRKRRANAISRKHEHPSFTQEHEGVIRLGGKSLQRKHLINA